MAERLQGLDETEPALEGAGFETVARDLTADRLIVGGVLQDDVEGHGGRRWGAHALTIAATGPGRYRVGTLHRGRVVCVWMGSARGVHLRERQRELAALDSSLGAAVAGAGRTVLIQGPAGMGKTTLLTAVRERAADEQVRFLSARASELERGFASGGLIQIFGQLLTDPPPGVLDGAAAGVLPVLGLVEREPGDGEADEVSFATLHALYWLCANLCSLGPVVIAIDDLHWLDATTVRFLNFMLPRAADLPLLVVATERTDEPGERDPLLEQLTSSPDSAVLELGALSPEAVREIIRERLGGDAGSAFCIACHGSSGGNPYVLGELLREIVDEGIEPSDRNTGRVADLAPKTVARSTLLRLARAGSDAVALARAISVLGVDAHLGTAADLAGIDIASAAAANDVLEAAGFLAPDELRFAHDLTRALVYGDMGSGERTVAHARAARLISERGGHPEDVAAHLMKAPTAGDPWVVDVLRTTARRAESRGARETAASYYERALDEPPPEEERPSLLLACASCGLTTGGSGARFAEAFELVDDPRVRAKAAPEYASTLFWGGRFDDAVAMLERTYDDVAGLDDELARMVDARLMQMSMIVNRVDIVRRRLERYPEAPPGDTPGQRQVLAAMAAWRGLTGCSHVEAGELAARSLRDGDLLTPRLLSMACIVLIAADRNDEARETIEAAKAMAGRTGRAHAFVPAAMLRSTLALHVGEVRDAAAFVRQGIDVVRTHGWPPLPLMPLYGQFVEVLVELDELDEAEAALEESGWPALQGIQLPDSILWARSSLRLAQGRIGEATDDLIEMDRIQEELGTRLQARFPNHLRLAPLLAAMGRAEEADRMLAHGTAAAQLWGTPRWLAMAEASSGLMAGDDGLDRLRRAVEILEESPAILELGRAELGLGSALRRTNSRAEAREPLRRALEIGRRTGSARLARLAREELDATGERVAESSVFGPDSLTPSESRIARLAIEGRSNAEIAQSIFVTQKTVEAHLTRAYRKLGISSRRELAAALAEDAQAHA